MSHSLTTTEISPALGVQVHDIDLRNELTQDVVEAVRTAYNRHHLLLFRGTELSPEDQMRVMSYLGPLCQESVDGPLYSFVSSKGESEVTRHALPYHSDVAYTPFGAIHAVSLYGIEVNHAVPTYFVSAARAARLLPAELRSKLQGRRVLQVYDFSGNYTHDRRMRFKDFPPDPPLSIYPRWDHPVIDHVPGTDTECIGINEMHSSHILGLPDEESECLMEAIKAIMYAPENTYTHIWQPNDLVVWSNRALQHGRPVHDRPDVRTLRRVSVNPVSMPVAHAGVNMAGLTEAIRSVKAEADNAVYEN